MNSKKTLVEVMGSDDFYSIQSFTDNVNTGIGYYMPNYLTQRLIDQKGFAMVCLKLDENWSETTQSLA